MVLLFRRGRKAPFDGERAGRHSIRINRRIRCEKLPDYPPPHTGDILVSGQDIENGLQAFNLNQLGLAASSR